MARLKQASVRNRLLAAMSPDDFALLQPALEPVQLELRQHVFRAGETISHLLFPESGLVSIVADIEEGRFEVGMAGWEGLIGVPLVLGVDVTPHTALIQSPGDGYRAPAEQMHLLLEKSASLRSLLLRYVHTFLVQVSQTAYANAGYSVEARLARWILMNHDRVESDELAITHEFMAIMLGTRRPGVTLALQNLEGSQLIRATRGRILIRNRAALEELAGDAYGFAEREYTNVLQLPIRRGQ
ncbi:Crp/Fnr family transcriptional regulator [Tianweitania sp. BSSL-BM11]|uniref:Crp/Fnr family transcriptional regulator n=1 Tax=Tianweitania aestuarii TaxID=2814886 RepID=A0ABS5RWN8_9HYPH|nr:Crp/Fnr family transcriptional regulator [Tianweitania aestuarii]MBS9721495.1 Crp/Fnr family transcriptional regulator [Tianweitania aestuarii]